MSQHDQLAAYVDGELNTAESAAFVVHLVDCAECRTALHDTLQLVALEAAFRNASPSVRPAADAAAPRTRRAAGRPARRRVISVITMAVAAAAAVLLIVGAWWHRDRAAGDAAAFPAVLASAPIRTIEGRLSYAGADAHRPYDVARAGAPAPARDAIDFDTFALLEHRNDLHGVAAAAILVGELSRVAAYLDRAAPSVDVAADRALLQLLTGHPREALIGLDDVLAAVPQHPQALWNRALALRDLGLPLSAAEAFARVAALGEHGWSAEARTRAQQLRDQVRERKDAFERLALVDGPRLAASPDAVTRGIAQRFPGMARLLFYDAVRGATSANTVLALAPLAHALDGVYGGSALSAYADRIAHADFARRAPRAARYAAIVAGGQLDAAGVRDFLLALRATKLDDILLGALVRLAPDGAVSASQISELQRLADASGDPWLHVLAIEHAVAALAARGNHAAAEALALPVLATCETSRLDYRCVTLALTLAESYRVTLRLAEAQRLLAAYVGRARRGGEWYLEDRFLVSFAELEMLSDDVVGSTLPIARAYAHEVVLREPQRCDYEVWRDELVALLLVNRVDLEGARATLARADSALARCPSASADRDANPDVVNMFLAAHVLRDPRSGTPGDVARVRAQIARARKAAEPGMQAMLDQIEGRLLLDRDHASGTALLEHAIAGVDALRDRDVNGNKARAYAYSVLTLDAARAGEWNRVWTLLQRAAGAPADHRCALGLALEDGTSMATVRDASGASRGVFRVLHPAPTIDAQRLVPAELRDALRPCPEIDVLARPPAQGLPEVLPVELAWSYRIDAASASGPPTETSRRDGDRSRAPLDAAFAVGSAPRHATRVVIANAEPPASLGVAQLSPWRSAEAPDVLLDGAAATPSRTLEELADATFIEIHAHGVVDASGPGDSFVMLSPDRYGQYALTAAAIRRQRLRGSPIVILAACHAAATATYRHEAWGLPAAFIAGGARAVIASPGVIDDAEAGAFFDDVRARIERGASPAIALRDARVAWLTTHPAAAWVRSLMVFQ